MHELALMESLVETVSEEVGDARVRVVRLEVGRLTGVVTEALAFAFDVCAVGTNLEGAALEIVEIPGRGRCRRCGADIDLDVVFGPCLCGSLDIEVLAGQELRIREAEVTGVHDLRVR